MRAIATRAPAVTPLPRALELARSLRPLKQRVPSPHSVDLDETATADQVTARRPFLPVLRPLPERWLSIALVVDGGSSMALWRSLADEFRDLLEQLGAFRSIRMFSLEEGQDHALRLHARPNGPPGRPETLLYGARPQAVLVVSDGVDAKWWQGRPQRLLEHWARHAPVALLQPFPERLWERTALITVPGRLRLPEPGAPNSRLRFAPEFPSAAAQPGLAIPILEFTPDWLGSWAQLVSGHAGDGVDGTVIWTGSEPVTPPPLIAERSAHDRVARFRAEASPLAYRLAGFLAAGPLTLPVMRLVQHTMLPGSRPSHLAEVFYSGLIHQTSEAADAESATFDFDQGVRSLLLSTIRRSEALQIIEKVSAFVAAEAGRPRESAALLTLPDRTGDQAVAPESRPYAAIPAEAVHRLGHDPSLAAETHGELDDTAALRRKLELVVAVTDSQTGQVMLKAVSLFQIGARPGDDARIRLRCAYRDEDGTVLAVVCWEDGGPRLSSLDSVRLHPGDYELRAVLEDTGRVRFLSPEGAVPDRRSWAELMAALPRTWPPPTGDTALICTIELGEEGFQARRELLRELIDLTRGQDLATGELKVAVIGYGDHVFRPEKKQEQIVRGSWLETPEQALTSLDRLKASAPGGLPVAPLEDALHQIAKRIATIPPGHRVVLLTAGNRPPHPARAGDPAALPCPHEYNWERLLRRIDARPGLLRAAVLDSGQYLGETWRRLGRDVLVERSRTDAHKLATAVRLLIPPSRRLSFPMLPQL
jgi:hypothetical protein